MTPLLQVRGLYAGYQGSQVLQGVDLEVEEGSILAVLGRNGVGKSTMVMSIMGLVPPSAGSVLLDGRELVGVRTDEIVRAGIGLIPQGRRVFAPLTVDENLRIAMRGRAGSRWTLQRIYELLPNLAVRRTNRGDQLSGGEQQMLAIGRALLGNPRLLLIDEPSDGLAPLIVAQITEIIRTLREDGVTMLLIEQDLKSALKVADRVAVMDKGAIVLKVSAAEFQQHPAQVEELLGVG